MFTFDAANNLNVTGSISASNPSVGTDNTTAPTSATEIGIIDGTGKLQGVSATNPVPITGTISASNPSVGTNGAAIPTSSTEIGASDGVNLQPLQVDASKNLKVLVNAALPAGTAVIGHVIADSGSTTAVTGNVTVVQPTGTNLHVVVDTTSTTAVTQATAANLNATVVGTGTFAVQSTTTDTAGTPVTFNAAAQTATVALVGRVGCSVTFSANASFVGTVILEESVDGGSTWTATDGFSTGNLLTAVGVAGFTPVNNSYAMLTLQGATNARARVSAYTSGSISCVLYATLSTPAITATCGTDGTNLRVLSTDTAGLLKNNMTQVAGVALVAASAGIQKVGISGNAAATLDGVITAATAPANALATLAVQNTTAPSLTTGQSVALQCDYEGSLFVKPYRRAQTVASKATITNSAVAVTVLPAQAAGIFADISSLVVTATPAASVSLPFTLTLSDGTATYVWDMETGALATSPADGTLLNFTFNPPIPATTAAVAWTIATNVATVTVHATSIAVLQKAG